MSSLDYAELAGLDLTMIHLKQVPIDQQDDQYLAVFEYIQNRIKHLRGK